MRKLLFICVFLFSCQKQKSLSIYVITLKYDELLKNVYTPRVEIDTIQEKNDSTAFKKAYSLFSGKKFTSNYIASTYGDSLTKNFSFKIVNESGNNIQEKLSSHFIDSIKKNTSKLDDEILKNLKKMKTKPN